MQTSNLIVVIDQQQYFDRYIKSGVLNSVAASLGCALIVNQSVDLEDVPVWAQCISSYEPESSSTKAQQWLLDLHTIRHRNLSPAFHFRVKRRFPNVRDSIRVWQQRKRQAMRQYSSVEQETERAENLGKRRFWLSLVLSITRVILLATKSQIRRGLAHILGSRLCYRLLTFRQISNSPFYRNLETMIRISSAKVVIWPSQAHDFVGASIIRSCKESGKVSLMLVDNWDNLCSKSVLWTRPDLMGVWGPQAVEHAMKYQGMSHASVKAIGTPRFEVYNDSTGSNPQEDDEQYVLFLGSYLYFDEFQILEIMQELLDDFASRSDHNLKILYRPHPEGLYTTSVPPRTLSRVVLCADHPLLQVQTSSGIEISRRAFRVMSKLETIANSKFVIGGLTSMLIEAGLVGRRYIALVHEEFKNPTSPHQVLKRYPHFQGIDRLPHVTFCRGLEDLSMFMWECAESPEIPIGKVNYESLSKYITTEPSTYAARLEELIKEALSVG